MKLKPSGFDRKQSKHKADWRASGHKPPKRKKVVMVETVDTIQCDRKLCPTPATHRVQVKSSRGTVLLDMKLCQKHADQEHITGQIGIAETVLTEL